MTGASGFIGRHLLVELGRRNVPFVLSGRRALGAQTDWGDLLGEVGIIVHLAALAHERAQIYERKRDYAALRAVNALATESLARAAAHAGVKRFVFVSTIGVHGEETLGTPFTEETPIAPRSLYATSKAEAERLLHAVSAETGLAVTVLRPTLVYGPSNPGNLLRLLKIVDLGLPLPLASVGNRRSLTYVGNLVAAIVALLIGPATSDTFIVADGETISTPQLVSRLAEALNRPARLFRFPPRYLEFAARILGREDIARRLLRSLEVDSTKMTRVLGWRAPFDTAHGLQQTAAWYRSKIRTS